MTTIMSARTKLLLCVLISVFLSVTPQSIESVNNRRNAVEEARTEQRILENVRPYIISLATRVMEDFKSTIKSQIQREAGEMKQHQQQDMTLFQDILSEVNMSFHSAVNNFMPRIQRNFMTGTSLSNDLKTQETIIQEMKSTINNLKSDNERHKQQTSSQTNEIRSLRNSVNTLSKLACPFTKGKTGISGNFCFIFSSDKVRWTSARTNCINRGGYLAVVNSRSITNSLKTIGPSGNHFWVGGHDRNSEGSWIWDQSGERVRYTNWNKGEPNDLKSEDCMTILMEKQGLWNDLDCNQSRQYVCQIPLISP